MGPRLRAAQSSFDPITWKVTSHARDAPKTFSSLMEDFWSSDEEASDAESKVEFSRGAKEELMATLKDDEKFDLGADGDAASRRTGFSASTGRTSNRTVNTQQFALQKAVEKEMAAKIRELELERQKKDEETQRLLDRMKALEAMAAGHQHGSPPVSGSAAAGDAHPRSEFDGDGSAAAQG